MKTSARNQFSGEVTTVTRGSVNDEVVLRTTGGLEIVAIITHSSSLSLELSKGKTATALVKASSVLLMVDVSAAQVSARNCIAGVVKAIEIGAVNSEVIVEASGGAEIASIITNASVERLNLTVGKPASAVFKASSVIIAVGA
ncbi:TOBE domain-containing protein [Achromobacter anxifer]